MASSVWVHVLVFHASGLGCVYNPTSKGHELKDEVMLVRVEMGILRSEDADGKRFKVQQHDLVFKARVWSHRCGPSAFQDTTSTCAQHVHTKVCTWEGMPTDVHRPRASREQAQGGCKLDIAIFAGLSY